MWCNKLECLPVFALYLVPQHEPSTVCTNRQGRAAGKSRLLLISTDCVLYNSALSQTISRNVRYEINRGEFKIN
ncbi:hypothetical protein RRG08_024559 [Elysia crispata]|uniref:Uncharacterized protein n=1 Tax=Elysia crispata TaxID=231223 RepID=A0AAE0ZWV4_9GAST|nr:hypothetical protein RRG08_024559 [Elysia crispata]